MTKPTEYEFTLPDGSKRYEIVDPDAGMSIIAQLVAFKAMHGATSAKPVRN